MYPRKVKLFKPWATAMVEGATVENPDYGKRSSSLKGKATMQKRRRKRRKRRKRNIRSSKNG